MLVKSGMAVAANLEAGVHFLFQGGKKAPVLLMRNRRNLRAMRLPDRCRARIAGVS